MSAHEVSPPESPSGPEQVSGRRRSRAWIGWVAFVLILAGGTAFAFHVATRLDGPPRTVTYTVVPHADDEFQVWSQLENTPEQYKVFIVLTQSEQTQYCLPERYEAAFQPGLERPAVPTPAGRWSDECGQARSNSLINFLTDMSESDPTIPGEFGEPTTVGPFPAGAGAVCRADDDELCTTEDHSAQVWTDQQGRGAVVLLNLGDGDLTAAEAEWGISTVVGNREALGINSVLPNGGIFGSFANSRYECFNYPHLDHRAVHDALWSVDFGAGFQMAATCEDDPAQSVSKTVSDESTDAAFRIGSDPDNLGERLGAHTSNYGWLHQTYYEVDREGQDLLFAQHQYFWVRFAD